MFGLTWGCIARCFLFNVTVFSLVSHFNLGPTISVPPGIHSETTPYVRVFKERCEAYGLDCSKLDTLSITVAHMPWFLTIGGNTIGVCDTKTNRILLQEEYWNVATYTEKELLVFHELAHCILDQEHVEDEDMLHVMNPIMMEAPTYQVGYQMFNDLLFNCSKNCPVVKFDRERYL